MARTEVRGTQIKDGSAGVDLTVDVFGVLPRANGGTGLSAAGTSGNALISNGTDWTSADPIPARLGASAKLITDWNTATTNGWYYSMSGATNGPPAETNTYLVGTVVAVDPAIAGIRFEQNVRQYQAGDQFTEHAYRRIYDAGNGGFSNWFNVLLNRSEMDARYALVGATASRKTFAFFMAG